MQEISRRCKVMFPAYTFPKRQLPNFLMYLNAMFDERISWYVDHMITRRCLHVSRYSNPMPSCLQDLLQSLSWQGKLGGPGATSL
jgi:hypothetical protein